MVASPLRRLRKAPASSAGRRQGKSAEADARGWRPGPRGQTPALNASQDGMAAHCPLSQQRLQLREIAGVEVGDGPKIDAAAAPGEQVIALARDEAGSRLARIGARPHEDVDEVQAALVNDRADAAA